VLPNHPVSAYWVTDALARETVVEVPIRIGYSQAGPIPGHHPPFFGPACIVRLEDLPYLTREPLTAPLLDLGDALELPLRQLTPGHAPQALVEVVEKIVQVGRDVVDLSILPVQIL
jgi:hypothetical protein